MTKGTSKGDSNGDVKTGSQERNRSRGRPKAKALPASKGQGRSSSAPGHARSSSAPGRPKSGQKVEPVEQEVVRRPKRASSTNSRPVRKPKPDAKKTSWEHPQGRPFKELREGSKVTGVVVNVNDDYGVFFDIGFEKNVILQIARRLWRRFRRGDIIEDLLVNDVDVENRRASVKIEDIDTALVENRMEIEELKKGSYVNGVVDQKGPPGIFVNIGVKGGHGRLQIPRFLGRHLVRGQVLRDLNIVQVDVAEGKIGLMLDDVEGAIEQMEMVSVLGMLPDLVINSDAAGGSSSSAPVPPPPAPQKSREPKAKPKAKSAASEKKTPAPAKAAKHVEEAEEELKKEERNVGFEVGDLVDGVVVKITATNVLVDIGLPKKCNLEVPTELKDEFRRGDRVQGMKVEKINSAGLVTLSMDDPELEVDVPPPPKISSDSGKGDDRKGKGGKGKGKGKAKGKSTK